MKKLLCFIFGHRWIYGDWKGIQNQPIKRACSRCKDIEKWYGGMSPGEGVTGVLWYERSKWRTDTKQKSIEEENNKHQNKFDEICNSQNPMLT